MGVFWLCKSVYFYYHGFCCLRDCAFCTHKNALMPVFFAFHVLCLFFVSLKYAASPQLRIYNYNSSSFQMMCLQNLYFWLSMLSILRPHGIWSLKMGNVHSLQTVTAKDRMLKWWQGIQDIKQQLCFHHLYLEILSNS